MEALSQNDKQTIQSASIFAELNQDDLEELYKTIQIRHLADQTILISEGEDAKYMYVLLEGKLEVYLKKPSGDRLTLNILYPSDIVGEDALDPNTTLKRSAHVVAVTHSRVAEIPANLITHLTAKYPHIKDLLTQNQILHNYDRMIKLMFNLHDIHIQKEDINYIHEEFYEPGQTIFKEGDQGDAIFFIISGQVCAKQIKSGREKLISRLTEGLCFGELALIDEQQRTATIVAEQPTKVLRIDKLLFTKWRNTHPIFADMLKSLKQVYHFRDGSLISAYTGKYEGKDCTTTVLIQTNGKQFFSTKIVNEETILFYKTLENKINDIKTITYLSPKKNIKRELQLIENTIVGVIATGPWLRLGQIISMIINEEFLSSTKIELFKQRGEIDLQYASELLGERTLVCNCMRVSKEDLFDAIKLRGHNMEDIVSLTGATLFCGNCKPLVKEIVHQS